LEITWLGHAAFRIRGKEGVVLTDPAPKSTGYNMSRPTADIVTISCDDPRHSAIEAVVGEPRRFDAPGEYEVSGVLMTGVRTTRTDGVHNTVFVIEMEEVRVCHLGRLDRMPTAAEIEAMNEPDILLVPAGAGGTLDGKQASELATLLNARIVIPMLYKTEASTDDLEPLENFLKATGQAARGEPQPKLSISRSQVPENLQVTVLDFKK